MQLEASEERIEGLESTSAAHSACGGNREDMLTECNPL